MPVKLIEYADATPEVRAVYDDIMRTRNVPDVNNFWKAVANDPRTLRRTWESLKEPDSNRVLTERVKEGAMGITRVVDEGGIDEALRGTEVVVFKHSPT